MNVKQTIAGGARALWHAHRTTKVMFVLWLAIGYSVVKALLHPTPLTNQLMGLGGICLFIAGTGMWRNAQLIYKRPMEIRDAFRSGEARPARLAVAVLTLLGLYLYCWGLQRSWGWQV